MSSPTRIGAAILIGALFAMVVAPALAQTDPSEGYVQSLRSLYKQPDASSETVGLLRPGDYIRVEHVHSLVYRVFRRGESDAAGFVVYPKLGPESPLSETPVRAASGSAESDTDGGAPAGSLGSARKMWVHAFVNIRSGPSTRDAVVAQLPPGSPVMVSGRKGRWFLVYKANETVFEQSRALGYVHESLLRTTEPPPEANPLRSADPVVAEDGESPSRDASRSAAVVNVNTATLSELESLPRIGPVLASRILEYREKNGPFRNVDDLVRVKGIGDKTLERLRPYLAIN